MASRSCTTRSYRYRAAAQRQRGRYAGQNHMQVALLTTFGVTKKEPLAVLLERIHSAFLAAGLGEPSILFTFSDAPVPGARSTIDRLLKKYPDFARLAGERTGIPNVPPIRQVSNRQDSPGAGEVRPVFNAARDRRGRPEVAAVSRRLDPFPFACVRRPVSARHHGAHRSWRDGDRLVVGQRPEPRRERADERRRRSGRQDTPAAPRACGRRARRVREDQEHGAGAARRGRHVNARSSRGRRPRSPRR